MRDKEKIKEFLMQVGPVRLALVGICGIFLVLTSFPVQKQEIKKQEPNNFENQENKNDNDIYTTKMENKLKTVLENVQGVGKVKVMITLSASRESVVNKDTPYENVNEQQEGNEKKTSRKESGQEETVLVEKDGNHVPYIIKEYEPEVEGVMAVIEGGDNPVVVSQVTDAIQALFHVEAHKIKVLKMEDGS